MIRAAFLSLILFSSSYAFAQTSPICDKAIKLTAGDTAVCEGVLFPPDWALEATKLKTVTLPKLRSELELVESSLQAKILALELELAVEKRFSSEQSAFLDTLIEEYQPSPWWESSQLWLGVGFVVGALSAISITYAVNDGD